MVPSLAPDQQSLPRRIGVLHVTEELFKHLLFRR